MSVTASPLVTGTLNPSGAGSTGTITLSPVDINGKNEPLATTPQYQIVSGNTPTGPIVPTGGNTTGTGNTTATLTPSADGLSCKVTGAVPGPTPLLLVIFVTAQGDPTAGVDDLYQEYDITIPPAPVLEDVNLNGSFTAV